MICLNYALYYDTVLVHMFSTNFTQNLVCNNTGLHTVDTQGHSRISSDTQSFERNFFVNNLALGHGHQYDEKYGFLPEVENDEFRRRPKRQVVVVRRKGARALIRRFSGAEPEGRKL